MRNTGQNKTSACCYQLEIRIHGRMRQAFIGKEGLEVTFRKTGGFGQAGGRGRTSLVLAKKHKKDFQLGFEHAVVK